MKFLFFLTLACSLFLSGCAGEAPAPPEIPPLTEAAQETTAAPLLSPEEEILSAMTLREKVGQLFIVRPDALDLSLPFETQDNSRVSGATFLTDAMARTLRDYPVGGFICFGKNIETPEQLLAFHESLSAALQIPPFLAVDEEGGAVARLGNTPAFGLPRFESAASVGAQGPEAVQEMGSVIGGYLKESGFNMDFAPVADVNTNPQNPVIGRRAFSGDPREAALSARAMADGLRMQGILPTFKHFPGHGDTAQDSHRMLAVSYKTKEELQSCEWIPFQQADDREAIMVGHIALPEVTGDLTPATFSPQLVGDVLRQELGFQGLILTDSLSMGAVISQYSPGQAALLALQAGCDILLMPASLPEAFDSVLRAVEEGELSEDILDTAVLRILRTKIDYHILNP